jgi:hypothetical protein
MRVALVLSVLFLSLTSPAAVAQEAIGASAWRAEAKDNICGLSNTRHVTNPAVVDYNRVLRATPEMKDLSSRDIDLRSAEGQILKQRAVDHVRRVGSKVMRKSGNCSLWKSISHRDGRKVKDLTDQVVVALSMSTASMGAASFNPGLGGSGEVFAAEQSIPESPSPGSIWAVPALMGLVLIAGWYAARKKAAALGTSGNAEDA